MNAVLIAALILSWGAIALLTLGFANLTMQIRELQSRGDGGPTPRDAHPELAAPVAGVRTVTLGVAAGCDSCTEVYAAWVNLVPGLRAAGHRPVLLSLDGSEHWERGPDDEFLRGEQLSAPFLLAYQPALLILDEKGGLLSADPIGSAEGLHDTLRALIGTEVTVGAGHGH